ncbi:MAG: cbb3-type cytochrome c oxidase subunit II [Chlamydiota bacterium]|nr:cbb3-type cytochrome c oxidase subunit II [Chlamydiota bacterium]
MSGKNVFYKLEWSAVVTVIGILILFTIAVSITIVAPTYLDPSWINPSSAYQKQMYEVADPNLYISSNTSKGGSELQFVYHIKDKYTLLAFQESPSVRFVAPENLQKYITKEDDPTLKLTSDLLLLREPKEADGAFNAKAEAEKLVKNLQSEWEKTDNKDSRKPSFIIWELFKPSSDEGFSLGSSEGVLENWVDTNYTILDESTRQDYHKDPGVIYVLNPLEYRVSRYKFGPEEGWTYDPEGEIIANVEELKSHELGFRSRHELIFEGEHIYAIEGCWYCHSDQTRTLVQDVVLNGNEDYPAPPSSANEYIYQEITFPATRRIGPDLSRVGIKRPSRDWHKSHFWSPKTASKGSIMPAFYHFFDDDPRGTGSSKIGIPNYRFEAIYQYLMTKGTRITPPTQAWWLGKDPINTKEIIEGKRKLP